ncbi:MAG: EAL domain-containing protein [Acidimicrobiales bacterium]|nr:EAL domain-containing protein [Acidimicrobiales bacterium]
MSDPSLFDSRQLETALLAVLEQNPDALISAINSEGIFVPMPPDLGGAGHRVMRFRSAIDIVVPADRVVILDAWERVRKVGAARGQVHLAGTPDETVTIQFFDVRERWGVFMCVVLAPKGTEVMEAIAEAPPLVPRVTWTRKSEAAEFIEVDPDITKILGWEPEELVGKRGLDVIHPDDQDRAIENWMSMLASTGDGQRTRLRHLRKDGSYVWMEFLNTNRLDEPDHHDVYGQMIDISDEMAAHEALRAREQLLNRLAEALPTGLLHINAPRQVLYTNERLHEILGVDAASTIEDQFRTVARPDWDDLRIAIDDALEGTDGEIEVSLRLPGTGESRLCHVSLRSLTEDDGTVNAAILTIADVTESVRLRTQLEERATYDALTRCYNRSSVMRILEETIVGPGERIGVVFIDLDRFKAINDELGHAAGDELLVIAADRIRSAVRGDDLVGRIGGDEFLVVCPSVSNPEEVVEIADRVAAVVRREVTLKGRTVDLRASVGVAWSGHDAIDADEIVARADAAMYESKRRGIGHPVVFASALRRTENIHLDDERALHHALERGDLAVHFQPIVELASGRPVGFESLVRWTRGSRGLPAAEFIDMAEQTGLIHDLGTHVRAEVVRGAVQTREATGRDRLWFLNLSTHELAMPGIVDSVLDLIESSGLSPSSLVVEFNGTQVDDDVETVGRTAQALHHAGVGLALDDFGARGSSLDLLRDLPLSWVKTCPTFTATMTFDSTSARIVEHLLALTDQLGINAVVKGVETPQQHELLLQLGARFGQGHLFAVAGPLPEILRDVLDT